MSHDQLFKELLQAFFREFMELFFPDVAVRLDFARVTFLDKETFTDLPEGEQREADVVAQVYTVDGQPEIILTHIEIQAQRRADFPARMFDYFALLRWRYRMPIFPIAIYLSRGTGGLTEEQYEERVFERKVNLFTFQTVGLPDLNADDYQALDNPLGPALSALMRTSEIGRVAHKYQSLRRMAVSQLDDARRALLTNVIEVYLQLSDQEQTEFVALIERPEGQEVAGMISMYEQRGKEQGIEQGIEQGMEQGIEQGIMRGKRASLLRQLNRRFGPVPPSVAAHLEAINDPEALDQLMDRIWTAQTLEEMGLPAE